MILWQNKEKVLGYSSYLELCSICNLIAACLNLPVLQIKTGTFANNVDPDETAHNEPSHQDLHCLLFTFLFY